MLKTELKSAARGYLCGSRGINELSNAAHMRLADIVDEPNGDELSAVAAMVHLIAELDSGLIVESVFRDSLAAMVGPVRELRRDYGNSLSRENTGTSAMTRSAEFYAQA